MAVFTEVSAAQLNDWVQKCADSGLLQNAKVLKTKITFDGGSGTIESKPDEFTN